MAELELIVVGAGVHGSATAYYAARTGYRTVLLEQFPLGHTRGSSHGASRIYRTAYAEGTAYVPLAQRAQRLWRDLSRELGLPLSLETGALMIGPPEGEVVRGALESARRWRLPHTSLSASEAHARFPAFALAEDEEAVFDPRAGVLFPERCLAALQAGARQAGARLLDRSPVASWKEGPRGFELRARGRIWRAPHLVLAAGAWFPRLVPELAPVLRVERQVMFWLARKTPGALVGPDRFPVFIWEVGGRDAFYGLPDLGEGVKVAHHGGRRISDPARVDRRVHSRDLTPVRRFVARRLPTANGKVLRSTTCLYTRTPDSHFILGPHPAAPGCILVSACSGHGFKFGTAVGEEVVRQLEGGRPRYDLSLFHPGRYWTPARRRAVGARSKGRR